jgi:transposase InsO family protein
VRFRFIEAEKANFSIAAICRVLQVTRSGFYAWRKRTESARWLRDRKLLRPIRASFYGSRRTYGSPRVHRELLASGERVSRKRVARLMREEGLESRRRKRFRRTTDSGHSHPVAANALARRFEPGSSERWWVGDVTFIWTMEGWLYLATLLDLTTRRVVGWSMSSRNDTALVLGALEMALARTGTVPHGHHSDRGSTYASAAYRRRLASLGILCSMSRRANCWDNAVAESFFSTVKVEWLDHHHFLTRAEARAAAFDFIEVFYNRQRLHSSLGYVSPEAYARALKTA